MIFSENRFALFGIMLYAIRPGTAQGSRLFSKERIGIANFSRIESEENITSQRVRKFFSDGEENVPQPRPRTLGIPLRLG